MKREMVEVILYENGAYEVKDIEADNATQRLVGWVNGSKCDIYHCYKSKWKSYLLKLLDTNAIDKNIRELQKRKKTIEKLRVRISKEIEGEV